MDTNENQTSTIVDTQTPLIYSRIAACLAEVGVVGKDHRNQQQGYAFRSIDDFYDTFSPVLARNKVFITPTILSHNREERTTKSGSVLMTTITHVRFRLWTEDGSFVEADALGEGSDSGDKSANKAAATAMKYLFMQVFSVRVNGETLDTERESPAYTPKAPHATRREYPVSMERTYEKNAPKANPERTAAKPAEVLPTKATDKTREWAWNALVAQFSPDVVWNYFMGKKWVPAEGTYDLWPLEHVPTSKQALAEMAAEIQKTAKVSTVVDTKTPPSTTYDDLQGMPEELAGSIITVPITGTKHADYVKNPQTWGQLYRLMKSGDEKSRKRYWGLLKQWAPQEWVDDKGDKRPPSDADKKCRTIADLLLDWEEGKKGAQ